MSDLPIEGSPQPAATPAPAPEPAPTLDTIISDAIAANSDEATAETARQRDERGRFKPLTPAAAAPAQPASDAAGKPDDTAAKPDPAAAQPVEPPARWSEEDKATFRKLPPEAQTILATRSRQMEAEFTRKTQEVAETRKAVEPVLAVTQRWNDYTTSIGLPPAQAFDQIMNVEYVLRQGTPEAKEQVYALLRDQYGVPISTERGQAAPEGPRDPLFTSLAREVAALKQERQAEKAREEQAAQQAVNTDVSKFAEAKDETGKLLYPHFERVRTVMARLIRADPDTPLDLKAVYDKAVRLDDELYQQTLTEARQQPAQDEAKRRQEAVDKARRAGTPVRGGTQPRGTVTGGNSLDALLSANIAKHFG